MTRRNATPQDAQIIATFVDCLNLERDTATVILKAVNDALGGSFIYAASADRPILTAIKDMQAADDGFFYPKAALTPAMQADAAAIATCGAQL